MRLLIEIAAAATPTPTPGVNSGGGVDLWKVIGGVGGIVGVLGAIATYGVGAIRPLSVKLATYWHAGEATMFSCVVKNRRYFGDRKISAVSLVTAPGWFRRTFWPFWKRKTQAAELIPFGLPTPLPTIGKRDQVLLEGELRKGDAPGVYDPAPRLRLMVHTGTQSTSTHLEKVTG